MGNYTNTRVRMCVCFVGGRKAGTFVLPVVEGTGKRMHLLQLGCNFRGRVVRYVIDKGQYNLLDGNVAQNGYLCKQQCVWCVL